MILIFCFNNLFEVLKSFFWCNCGYDKYIIMADISKTLKWTLNRSSIYNWFIPKWPKISWPYWEGNVHSLPYLHQQINELIGKNNKHIAIAE